MQHESTPFIEIPLTQGKVALVSPEDAERVLAKRWHAVWNGWHFYAKSNNVYLHRFILGAPRGTQIDHANRDGLDCRRGNIRIASASQNASNKAYPVGMHGFRGVRRDGKRWAAQLTVNYKNLYLGRFDTPEEAARAYDKRAREIFGEFARVNFP